MGRSLSRVNVSEMQNIRTFTCNTIQLSVDGRGGGGLSLKKICFSAFETELIELEILKSLESNKIRSQKTNFFPQTKKKEK